MNIFMQWRNGEIDDREVLATLQRERPRTQDRMQWDSLIARVHMERGDFTSAKKILERLPASPETSSALKEANGKPNLLEKTSTFNLHESPVRCMDFSKDGSMVVSCSSATMKSPKNIFVWNPATCQTIREYILPNQNIGGVSAVAFHPSGLSFLVGYGDGTILRWSVHESSPISELLHPAKKWDSRKPAQAIACSPDGSYALAAAGKELELYDLQKNELYRTFAAHQEKVNTVVCSPDGLLAASYCLIHGEDAKKVQSKVYLWEIESGILLQTIKLTENVYSLAFAGAGRQLLTAGNLSLCLWDAETGELIQKYGQELNRVRRACLSPSGQTVIKFEPHSLAPHSDYTMAPDSLFSVSSSLSVFEKDSGMCRLSIYGGESNWDCMAFSPDGRRFAITGESNRIDIWNFNENSYTKMNSDWQVRFQRL